MVDDFVVAEMIWGFHPWGWPRPPRKMPRWWQWKQKQQLANVQLVFKGLTQAHLNRFYEQAALGQAVDEDAGGYLLRCYQAMMGVYRGN